MLNHLPLFGIFFGLVLLIAGALARRKELTSAALVFFLISAVAAVPVYLSGEPSEEAVENLPGFQESLVEQHEELAETTFIAIEILGLMAFAGLVLQSRGHEPRASYLGFLLAFALGTLLLVGYTANLGGQIRHTEVRSGGGALYPIADDD
jgi:peptidoglycan/LPS O-acetylase OafA/YrhL